jgi:hypothetical protein
LLNEYADTLSLEERIILGGIVPTCEKLYHQMLICQDNNIIIF